jgi:YgiT-type zinc finger domain-containing protein
VISEYFGPSNPLTLIHDTRDVPYVHKGESTSIPEVTGDFCPACGEVVLNREHGDRYSELLAVHQRQVNAAYVDPSYIAKVRKKLDPTLSSISKAWQRKQGFPTKT